jgi:hypothetical protein
MPSGMGPPVPVPVEGGVGGQNEFRWETGEGRSHGAATLSASRTRLDLPHLFHHIEYDAIDPTVRPH